MDSALITPRPLESALFGVSLAAFEPLSAEAVAATVVEARDAGHSMLIARVPAQATDVIHALEAEGAFLCDTLVTVTRLISASSPASLMPEGFTLRHATLADAEGVAAVAGKAFAGFSGHWHADPRLSRDLATELYRRWGGDLVRGIRAGFSVFVVANAQDEIVAFLGLRDLADGSTDVPLTAVDPSARGHGLLAAMLEEAKTHLSENNRPRLDYETQLVNAAALRVVLRAGFLPSSSRFTFHLWLDQRR